MAFRSLLLFLFEGANLGECSVRFLELKKSHPLAPADGCIERGGGIGLLSGRAKHHYTVSSVRRYSTSA